MTAPRTVPGRILPMSEKAWLAWVIDTADKFGWAAYHPWLSLHSQQGWPDLALCRPPRLILAELKSDTGKVTPTQAQWMFLLAQCPVEVYTWRPAEWKEVAQVLAPEGRHIR